MNHSDHEWGIMSFGYGEFQQCKLKHFFCQNGVILADNPVQVISDQPLYIGVEVTSNSTNDRESIAFVKQFEKVLGSIELSFQMTHQGVNVFREIYQGSSFSSGSTNAFASNFCHLSGSTVTLYFYTSLKVATKYLNHHLMISFTLNIRIVQGRPFNQRIVMDEDELDVRLLLDLHRYRPTKIPARTLNAVVVLYCPIHITSAVRETSPYSSLVSICIENKHTHKKFLFKNVAMLLDHTYLDEKLRTGDGTDNGGGITGGGMTATSASPMVDCAHTGAHNEHSSFVSIPISKFFEASAVSRSAVDGEGLKECSVVLHPGESYIFVYNISAKREVLDSLRCFPHNLLWGSYVTPFTISWEEVVYPSIACLLAEAESECTNNSDESITRGKFTQRAISDILTPSSLPVTLNTAIIWCVGTQYATNYNWHRNFFLRKEFFTTLQKYDGDMTETLIQNWLALGITQPIEEANAIVTSSRLPMQSLPLDISVHGPSIACIHETITLSVVIRNNTPYAIVDAALITSFRDCIDAIPWFRSSGALDSYNTFTVDDESVVHRSADYTIAEASHPLRDILPGCTEVISLHMTTLQEGTIFMRDLFLVERTNWIIRQVASVFQLVVVKHDQDSTNNISLSFV